MGILVPTTQQKLFKENVFRIKYQTEDRPTFLHSASSRPQLCPIFDCKCKCTALSSLQWEEKEKVSASVLPGCPGYNSQLHWAFLHRRKRSDFSLISPFMLFLGVPQPPGGAWGGGGLLFCCSKGKAKKSALLMKTPHQWTQASKPQ